MRAAPDDPALVGLVAPLWAHLSVHNLCPFCGHEVEQARFPWRFRSHNIHGACQKGTLPTCAGSRSVFTLDALGLGDAFLP